METMRRLAIPGTDALVYEHYPAVVDACNALGWECLDVQLTTATNEQRFDDRDAVRRA